MDPNLSAKVWKRLAVGKSMDGLGLPMIEGRTDLTGLTAPSPLVTGKFTAAGANLEEQTNLVVLRGVTWKGLNFSRAILQSLRFFDCEIEDCSFDEARCRDWRMWGTRTLNTTFRSADLRESALGTVDENGRRNLFHQVNFANANLKDAAFKSADITACKFENVSHVDFGGTVFVDCVFEGTLNNVLFYTRAFHGENWPPNEMKNVDFRHARLRHVGFRGLDMSDVRWPNDDEHMIVGDYTATLDRLLETLGSRTDDLSKKLTMLVANKRKWAGANQNEGVINLRDWTDVGGEEMVREFVRLVQRK